MFSTSSCCCKCRRNSRRVYISPSKPLKRWVRKTISDYVVFSCALHSKMKATTTAKDKLPKLKNWAFLSWPTQRAAKSLEELNKSFILFITLISCNGQQKNPLFLYCCHSRKWYKEGQSIKEHVPKIVWVLHFLVVTNHKC